MWYPPRLYEAAFMEPLLDILRSAEFRQELDAMGGYDTGLTGEVMATVAGGG